MSPRTLIVIATLLAGLASTPAVLAEDAASDNDKAFYALGAILAQNVSSFNLSEAELEQLLAGFKDSALGNELAVDINAYRGRLQELQQARMGEAAATEKIEAEKFLTKMAEKPGATRTESGIVIIPSAAGDGPSPAASDTVKVHYHGTLRDGSVFDSSVDRGEPATFPLNRVIPCWTEAMQTLNVGGKATIVCPPDLAYGDQGAPPMIKPGAALTFEVELLGIE